ncbi:MAG: nucleotide pyrophosphohydrolase [Undibacterium curvum]|uniref:nucleotide pyrophosphohydrolase n=1 Tax=Undibacterium curvum TaxID=2762294 RepID=UPI003BE7F701
MQDSLTTLQQALREFAAERDWAQFHTPKNLAAALTVEAAELLEIFQWLPSGEKDTLSPAQYQAAGHEMADVLCYLLMAADRLQIDLVAVTQEKIRLNALKYPVARFAGKSDKYDQPGHPETSQHQAQ